MLLLDDARLDERRAAARGPLAPLVASLAADLDRVIAADPRPDPRKARMTRAGGRCARDGTLLAFDPFDGTRHRCPRCGATHAGDEHERWWVMWYQLWLAERAVHAAVLHLLVDAPPLARFARDTLARFADAYDRWPNVDNVLGPTRPFFSTYLESLWLLACCVALDALEAADARAVGALGADVRARLVAPSRALIASYPEPGSNRQVWNAAACLAASRLLDDARGVRDAFDGAHGVRAQLARGILADGSWYEGENYHQFAHRGLWYGVTMGECAGLALAPDERVRYDAAFAVPFLSALPDFTLPARRDSQYAIALRQWRWAESCELGLARTGDPRLAGALARLYAPGAPPGDTGRWRTAGESERNEPPVALDRSALGWKSLLHALPTLPDATEWSPDSALLAGQGLAVLRGDGGRLYAALDYGVSGGGHGHPDRLGLVVADGATRWLDDPGTGSYVERTLHWYRSTLAHSAPLVDGRSQPPTDGTLRSWAPPSVAAAARIAPGVEATRAIALVDGVLLDRIAWRADRVVRLDLPLHLDADDERHAPSWRAFDPGGAGGLEDGFDFLEDAERAPIPASLAVRAPDGAVGRAWILAPEGATLWRARAPGPPGAPPRRFHAVRVVGTEGVVVTVLDPRRAARDVRGDADELRVAWRDGRVLHAAGSGRWTLAWADGADRATVPITAVDVALADGVPSAEPRADASHPAPAVSETPLRVPSDGSPVVRTLGEADYRRSECDWRAAGGPTARLALWLSGDALHLDVDVRLHRAPRFVPAGATNPLDNERPEVNGDGVQLHLVLADAPVGAGTDALASWLLVPEPPGDAVRVIPTTPRAAAHPIVAGARHTPDGYALAVAIPRETAALGVVVNEMPAGRERRRGQLVLGGARGEFVYLQGDRLDAERCLPLVVAPASPTAVPPPPDAPAVPNVPNVPSVPDAP